MTNETTAPERIWTQDKTLPGDIDKNGYWQTGLDEWAYGFTEYVRADALEAAQARIAELEQHISDMIDDSGQECACGYDNPTDICLGHLPMYRKAQARIAELEGECARRAALIPIAYGEGVVDVFTRGATIENSSEKFETCDAKAALDDPEVHRNEWPDNFDNAIGRAALEGKG